MNLLFSIIIPTYNRLPILKLTLEMYEKQENLDFDFEIIVIDDGSNDETWNYLSQYNSSKFLFSAYHQSNQGQGPARNLAINHAQGKYLLITGDDIIPSSKFLSKHYQAHLTTSDTLAVLGKIVWHPDLSINSVMKHIDGIGAQQFSYYYLKDRMKLDFRHFYTSNISLLRAEMLKLDKLFDPDFHLYGYEDVELAYRLMGNKHSILYCEDIIGYHYHGYTLQGFCQRQYRAGRMACVLKNKHPEVGEKIGFADFERVLENASRIEILVSKQTLLDWESLIIEIFEKYSDDNYEWLNDIYLSLFQYFYLKGMLEGQYSSEKVDFILPKLILICLAAPIQRFLKSPEVELQNKQSIENLNNIVTKYSDIPQEISFYSKVKPFLKKVKNKVFNMLQI